jgi:hypothetical protein
VVIALSACGSTGSGPGGTGSSTPVSGTGAYSLSDGSAVKSGATITAAATNESGVLDKNSGNQHGVRKRQEITGINRVNRTRGRAVRLESLAARFTRDGFENPQLSAQITP